jgi:hypothetical protein
MARIPLSSSPNRDVDYYNTARLAQTIAAIDTMFVELYQALITTPTLLTLVPFNQTIPLSGGFRMPAQAVAGPLTFTPGANPLLSGNGSCRVLLTANGSNVPSFAAFGSAPPQNGAWVNTAGAVNLCIFGFDGTNYNVSIWQGGPGFPEGIPVQAPSVASVSLIHGLNPQLTIATGGSALNPGIVPPASAFSLVDTDGATVGGKVVSVTANSVVLQLAGTVALGDVLTLNYTPPTTGSYFGAGQRGPLQDANGNLLAAFAGAPVTVS